MNIAYFDSHGMLIQVSPRNDAAPLYECRDVAYNMDALVLDGKTYDLTSCNDIQKIPVPDFYPTNDILEMSYIFKIRCGMETDASLVPTFVDKTLELMQASSFLWRRRDYLQAIRNYYYVGLFERGDAFEAAFRAARPDLFSYPEDSAHEVEHLCTKFYYENKWRKYQEYDRIKELCPDLAPSTPKGYFQIRTRKTKRFLEIMRYAAPYMEFELEQYHFCRKYQAKITPITKCKEIRHKTQSWTRDESGTLVAVPMPDRVERVMCLYDCPLREKYGCNGKDDKGLWCIYGEEQTDC